MLRALPSSAHVVIDEAYHHHVDDASDYRSFIDSRVEDARIIVTRTFSKLHGLSGMRIGFAITSPETAAQLIAGRPPAAVSVIAARAAVAALGDTGYVRASRTRNADDRQEFFNQASVGPDAGHASPGYVEVPFAWDRLFRKSSIECAGV